MNIFARFAQDESGATAIEYGLIAALIAVGIIAAISLLGNELAQLFNGIADDLDTSRYGGTGAGAGAGTTTP